MQKPFRSSRRAFRNNRLACARAARGGLEPRRPRQAMQRERKIGRTKACRKPALSAPPAAQGRVNALSSEESEETDVAKEALSGARLEKVLAALKGNWDAEMDGYHTYQTLADRDTDPVRAQVLRQMADAEQ